MKKLVTNPENPNGILVEMTAEQVSAREADIAEYVAGAFDGEMKRLREQRNHLLSETDWVITKAKETATSIPVGMKTYRQELRDLPSGLTTVEEVQAVTFPTKP